MEFKKCDRCGCFFTSNGDICVNCSPKDKLEINKLKNYFDNVNSTSETNIDLLSYTTGITKKNLNRFLNTNEFSGIVNNFGINLNGKLND